MAKKQTFVVGSTNPVTESRTDAQLNTAWNQYEVLKAGELDGVLNAMSAQTLIDSEEITNALDVYNITPNPNDNTQLKQLLTQMDNKIDQIISGGEIIGSFWYGKTTPGFTVPAPTDIGQTYVDFTTLNHYISNDGSTWTLNGTLTLPALQDAIVLVTSKFWDIIEQQDQYGGRAIYSQDLSQWVYYPTIISIDLSNYVNTTGPQTIPGSATKTFEDNSNLQAVLIKSKIIDDNVTPGTQQHSNFMDFLDKNGVLCGRIYLTKKTNGANGIAIQAWKGGANYSIEVDSTGITVCPTPETTSNANRIATTAFVKSYAMGQTNWAGQQTITSGFTATKPGYVYATMTGGEFRLSLYINGYLVAGGSTSHAGSVRSALNPVKSGDVVTFSGAGTVEAYFVPCSNY